MSKDTIRKLIETRLRVVNEVNSGKLSMESGSALLGITRQGLWKLRKSVEKYGSGAVTGRKRGPKTYYRVHNRTEAWIEDTVEKFFTLYGVGADRICWLLEDVQFTSAGPPPTESWSERGFFSPSQKKREDQLPYMPKGIREKKYRLIPRSPLAKKE